MVYVNLLMMMIVIIVMTVKNNKINVGNFMIILWNKFNEIIINK